MKSKENEMLFPFFNSLKQWHFEELRKETGISKPQLSLWLKKLQKSKLIKKVEEKGKMPYYLSLINNPEFKIKKRFFALNQLEQSGLLKHLIMLNDAKTIIIFGSFSRWDWYSDSDIDIFIYGDSSGFEVGKYESKIKREIQIHTAKNKKELQKMKKLMPYIISGDFIKGSIDDLEMKINA